jgi:hypothetical protein
MRFTQVQYEKDTQAHIVAVQGGGGLAPGYAGQDTRISTDNPGRVQWLLTISERQRLFIGPDCDPDEAVCFYFPDGAQYTLTPDDSVGDAAYLCDSDGGDLWFRIEGDDAMDRAVHIVSPEGVNGPNEVIGPAE